jgi:uncharacterized protein (DUF427 family)
MIGDGAYLHGNTAPGCRVAVSARVEVVVMARAVWNGAVIAESEDTVVVEGNHYFPPSSLDVAYLRESSHTSICPWKGVAGYFDIVVDGQENPAAAWIYRDPSAAAAEIKDHVAFWKGVSVEA